MLRHVLNGLAIAVVCAIGLAGQGQPVHTPDSIAGGFKVTASDSLKLNVVSDSSSYTILGVTIINDNRVTVFNGINNLVTGMAVSGAGIAASTTIGTVNGSGLVYHFGNLHSSTTIDNIGGSTYNGTGDLAVGMRVECGQTLGCSIPSGTFITAIPDTHSVTISQAALVSPGYQTQIAFRPTITLAGCGSPCNATASSSTTTFSRTVLTVTNTQRVTLGALLINTNNTTSALSLTADPITNFTQASATLGLSAGILQSVSIQSTAMSGGGKVDRNSGCANVQIIRGGAVIATLVEGFPTIKEPIYWPGMSPQGCSDGPGHHMSFIQLRPNPGDDFVINIPADSIMEIIAVSDELQTGSAPGGRAPYLVTDDGEMAPYAIFPRASVTGHTPSTNILYSWINGGGTQIWDNVGAAYTVSLPFRTKLIGGYRVRTITVGIQPADQWQDPGYTAIVWPVLRS